MCEVCENGSSSLMQSKQNCLLSVRWAYSDTLWSFKAMCDVIQLAELEEYELPTESYLELNGGFRDN